MDVGPGRSVDCSLCRLRLPRDLEDIRKRSTDLRLLALTRGPEHQMQTTTQLTSRQQSLWGQFASWITSTQNRLYIGWFGCLMIPTLLTATTVFILAFVAAPPVDIDRIREPVSRSLFYGNNIITGAVVPTSNAIGLHLYSIWEASSLSEWLYNGGPYQMVILHVRL